jgi:hypothetical protein
VHRETLRYCQVRARADAKIREIDAKIDRLGEAIKTDAADREARCHRRRGRRADYGDIGRTRSSSSGPGSP